MKKLIALLITLASLFLMTGIVHAAGIFPDVSQSHKNHDAIIYLYQEGVINGYPDGTFKPENTLNRAELLKILVLGGDIDPSASTYKN